ncbi:MAG: type II toxin-antitoxin system PemK/MazF family toxin [Chloroflexi bacterium]|nr:type II toxin-antitoxin system PemK/MazF family toxin [Chloroflexota bacterium]
MLERGEVWQVDFGVTQKVRPALVINISYGDADRALIGVIPNMTATRGSQFEVAVPAHFLAGVAFLVQGIQAVPPWYFLLRVALFRRGRQVAVTHLGHGAKTPCFSSERFRL